MVLVDSAHLDQENRFPRQSRNCNGIKSVRLRNLNGKYCLEFQGLEDSAVLTLWKSLSTVRFAVRVPGWVNFKVSTGVLARQP
jgi:hypothetical protein